MPDLSKNFTAGMTSIVVEHNPYVLFHYEQSKLEGINISKVMENLAEARCGTLAMVSEIGRIC